MSKKEFKIEKRREIAGYLKTFFITLCCITIVISLMVLVAKIQSEKPPEKAKIAKFKENQINLLIEHYKYQQSLDPTSYVLHIDLGLIYESVGRLKEAQGEYEKAIKYAPYGNFKPTFLLAQLLLQEKKLEEASALVDKIKEYPDPQLIASKAAFYSKSGDAYYYEGKNEDAVRQYKNALYYQEKTPFCKIDVRKLMPKAYTALSRQYLNEGKVQKAIDLLEEGKKLSYSPELSYRQALIYTVINPEKALDIFESVKATDPTLIDYNVYSSLLENLVKSAQASYNDTLADSYETKLKIINRFKEDNIVLPSDFGIEELESKYHRDVFGKLRAVDLSFVLRNNTYADVRKLFVQVKAYNNNEVVVEEEQRIATAIDPIRTGRLSQTVKVRIFVDDSNSNIVTDDISAIISVKRNERFKRTILCKILIPKNEEKQLKKK